MCINPVTNTSVAKAGFRKQEAPQLQLITTSVYPVGLGISGKYMLGRADSENRKELVVRERSE